MEIVILPQHYVRMHIHMSVLMIRVENKSDICFTVIATYI